MLKKFIKKFQKNLKKVLTYSRTCSNILLVLVSATAYKVQCASGSAVEHLLAKEGVAGSIPVSRSFLLSIVITILCVYREESV